jgi:two-component system, NtrC family, sensor histidine kinase PilS
VLGVIGAAVVLPRPGGLVVAAVASLLYTGVVLGSAVFPLNEFFEAPSETTGLEIVTIFIDAGTFLVVAVVAGWLATHLHAAREELERQTRDLRDVRAFRDLIFHSVEAGLVAIDRDGERISAFNRAAEEQTGWPADAAVGRSWTEVFGPAIALGDVAQALGRDGVRSIRRDASLHRRDGAAMPVRLTFSPLRSGDGAWLGLIAVSEDLSAIRAMEVRMRQADRLATLGRLSANIAHELRNPLASLTGAAEALAGDLGTPEARQRLGGVVLTESGRLNRIITDFLEYAHPAPVGARRVNAGDIVDDVFTALAYRAGVGRVKLVRDIEPGLRASVDPQQFRQALWSLGLSALDAMPDGGELRVSATHRAGRLEIQLSDTGDPIAPDDLGHVFEPFSSTRPGGSGLALALTHRIVRDHGGDIDVRSAPGAGTTFTLTFPSSDG